MTEPVDRTAWPPGPWDGEPDEVRFQHEGYDCVVRRHPRLGHLNGYVRVPEGHPLHGKPHSATAPWECLRGRRVDPVRTPVISLFVQQQGERVPLDLALDVHGGISFSGPAWWAEPAGWWLGFDTGHGGDTQPAMLDFCAKLAADFPHVPMTYRDLAYARAETERLASQLADWRWDVEDPEPESREREEP